MIVERRNGTVDDASNPDLPLVSLDPDGVAWETINMLPGYAPTVGDRVTVLIGGGRVLVGATARGWRTDAPDPVFDSGVTVGNGTIDDLEWLIYREAGVMMMRYRGRLLLGSETAITGTVGLTIPGGFVLPAGKVQHGGGDVTYYDASDRSQAGWWAANADADPTVVSLRITPGGTLDANEPFTWEATDVIRWDIKGLEITTP